jgi:hypothetical protein
LRTNRRALKRASVLECGSPLPLFRLPETRTKL